MKTDEFLDRVKERLGTNRGEAERQTRAVLRVLAEQVSREEGFDLASQLPKELKDAVVTMLGSSLQRGEMDDAYFFGRVQTYLDLERPGEAMRVTRGVLSVLNEAVSPGQIEDIAGELPAGPREMIAAP